MDEIQDRLVKCFENVFPDLPASEIPQLFAGVEQEMGFDSGDYAGKCDRG